MARSTVTKQPVTIRLSAEVREAIKEIMRRTGRDFSSVAHQMLEEAIKMRRIPGIFYTDTPSGRHAHIGGTGLGVWEIIRLYRQENNNWEELRATFDWLSEQQLRTALAYAEAYPEEIDSRIADEDQWTPEAVYAKYPFMKPPWL